MKPADDIKQFFKKAAINTNSNMDNAVLHRVLMAQEKPKPAVTKPKIWRIIMKSPITRLATAAIVIIACLIGLSLWKGTESGIVLADVLARVEQVKAFRCKMSLTMYSPGKPDRLEQHGSVVMSREYGYKGTIEVRDPNGGRVALGKRYFYPKKKTLIQIGHPIKTYFRWEVDDAEAQWNQEFLSQYSDPGALLRDIVACKYETLGRSTIDGVEVEGFRTTDPNCRSSFSKSLFKDPQAELDVKIWVDVKTRLPVRCEDFASGRDEMENPWIVQSITADFEWDIPITAAEFDPPPVPDGYAVVNSRPEPSDEEAVIQGLRQCVALFGNYLESISDNTKATELIFLAIEKSETPAALGLKKRIKELTEDKKLDSVRSAGWPLRRLIWFYVRLIQDKKEPAYYGKTVTPKDADKVLLRWKLSENKYRVILGDLHTETVSGERLAELENLIRQPRVKAAPTAEQETSPAVKAGNIIWVSDVVDQSGDGKPDDQAWVDMLKARGYTVDYTKGAAPKEGYWRTLDNDKVAALNAADLIIVSRCIGPIPPYVKDGESTKWNSVKTPMILMHTYFARRRCWSWLDTHTPAIGGLWGPPGRSDVSTLLALVPNHPIFKDVQLDSKNQVKIFDQTVGSGKVSFNAIADVGNGTLIAKPSDQDWTFIAEWEPGSEFYPGAGQTPGGRRMIFAAGTIEWAAGGCGRGEYNLNAQGEKLFINMIEYMLGNLVQEPDAKKKPTSEQKLEPDKS